MKEKIIPPPMDLKALESPAPVRGEEAPHERVEEE